MLRVTSVAGSRVPVWPSGKPTNAAPHCIDGKVGKCPVAWKNWHAARDHSTTGAQDTLKPAGRGEEGERERKREKRSYLFTYKELYNPLWPHTRVYWEERVRQMAFIPTDTVKRKGGGGVKGVIPEHTELFQRLL